jgi:hypothetical protein
MVIGFSTPSPLITYWKFWLSMLWKRLFNMYTLSNLVITSFCPIFWLSKEYLRFHTNPRGSWISNLKQLLRLPKISKKKSMIIFSYCDDLSSFYSNMLRSPHKIHAPPLEISPFKSSHKFVLLVEFFTM